VFAIAAVSFANVAWLTSDGRTAGYVADRAVRIAAIHIGPPWLLFVLAYAGKGEWIMHRTVAGLWAYPLAFIVLSVTTPSTAWRARPPTWNC